MQLQLEVNSYNSSVLSHLPQIYTCQDLCALGKRLALEIDEYMSDNECSAVPGAIGSQMRGGGGGGGGGDSLRAARKRRRQHMKERASSTSQNYELDGTYFTP